jgi:hypothetical protein
VPGFNVNAAPSSTSEGNFQFLAPGIYRNGRLKEIVLEQQKLNAGGEVEVIAFYLQDENGAVHRHIEFAPGDDADEKKVLNKIARVKHIVRCFNPEEITAIETDQKQLSFNTFAEFGNWAISAIGNANEDTKIDFKLLGSVNNGKAISKFPGYVGFMCVHGEGTLTFGNKEMKQNAEYHAALSAGDNADGDDSLTSDAKPAGGWAQ